MRGTQVTTIDEYIATFSKDIQKLLNEMRTTIRKAAPKAEEIIKYAMPTFKMNKNLVISRHSRTISDFIFAPLGNRSVQKKTFRL